MGEISVIELFFFALIIDCERRSVNGVITIELFPPASLIEGKIILNAVVTSPSDSSFAPTGTDATIGLFWRH